MFCPEDGYKLTPGRKKKTPINFRAWLENEEGNKIWAKAQLQFLLNLKNNIFSDFIGSTSAR